MHGSVTKQQKRALASAPTLYLLTTREDITAALTFAAAFNLEKDPDTLAHLTSVLTGRIGGHLVGLTTTHELQYYPSICAYSTH